MYQRHLRAACALVVSCALVGAVHAGTPLGTGEFSYAGQLKANGAPVNGQTDLTFTLWDDPVAVGASQIGQPDVYSAASGNPITVAGGLFTVSLNSTGKFGPTPFNGDRRWLEISVGAQKLSPRQPITPTPYALQTRGITVTDDGLVGIGTRTPDTKLHVADGRIRVKDTASGNRWDMYQADSGNLFAIEQNATGPKFVITGSGLVGIGTTAPDTKLHIADGRLRLKDTPTGNRWDLFQTNNGTLFRIEQNAAYSNFAITGGPAGHVGIGTDTPASKLDIVATGPGAELLRFTTERPWIFRQTLTGPSTCLELYSTSGQKTFQVTAVNGANVAAFVADDANPRVGIGTTAPQATLDVNGRAMARCLDITGGCDLAEAFDVAGDGAKPGMVMVIDPEHTGKLKVASKPYDRGVAGIISGAGGINTGMVLSQAGALTQGDHKVALSGRVYCLCDASLGAIEPSDMLTTSATPGHAMKATDRDRAFGAVIGKAMSELTTGKGLVLVLVTLQ